MSEETGKDLTDEKKNGRDRWEKAEIILQPVGGFLTAIAVACLTIAGSYQMNQQRKAAEKEARAAQGYQLYSDLQSRREQADSDLRKSMFDSIISTFMRSDEGTRSTNLELLNLELLVYNFHDALNLKPLFLHLEREYSDPELHAADLERLRKIGREISRRQSSILETVGTKKDFTVDFSNLKSDANPTVVELGPEELGLKETNRDFTITVLEADPKHQELRVRLEVVGPKDELTGELAEAGGEFRIGFFDFPMIDNTRLSDDQRCALSLKTFGVNSAQITLLYFEGHYSSLRDKPAYNEIVEKLKPD